MSYMDRAIKLAKDNINCVSPNPSVGAVLVKDGTIIGEGQTQIPGSSHAEIIAINEAKENVIGSTLYTTLEPCSNMGRTPPCVDAIIKSGISKVIYSILDPNPIVNGEGISKLRDSGIEVELGDKSSEAKEIIEAYSKFISYKIPFITAKYAMSLDGKITTDTGKSKWISSLDSRIYVHSMRANSDAVMVGINTILNDNPLLSNRNELNNNLNQPIRIIIDSNARTPLDSKILKQDGETLIIVANANKEACDALSRNGAKVVSIPGKNDKVDLVNTSKYLGDRNITSVLVEGGSILLGSLFEDHLIDKVVAFVSPKIIGGIKSKSPVVNKGIDFIENSSLLKDIKVNQINDDVLISGYIVRS
ncbi:MAG: bifunctional diaminohydroxyphosphoribosylaminopyrimidine deaminase/5-amino-6-(5-phosphoribosylamino)uracil reductase RibD [Dehalococcoidia bacterium]